MSDAACRKKKTLQDMFFDLVTSQKTYLNDVFRKFSVWLEWVFYIGLCVIFFENELQMLQIACGLHFSIDFGWFT